MADPVAHGEAGKAARTASGRQTRTGRAGPARIPRPPSQTLRRGARGMRPLAGRRRVRTGRLGRAQRAGLLRLREVLSLLLGALQVRSPPVCFFNTVRVHDPCIAVCPAAASLSSSSSSSIITTATSLQPSSPKHKLTSPPRRLRMALGLDLQLRLRLRPLQLADPNHRRPSTLRRLGPRRSRRQLL